MCWNGTSTWSLVSCVTHFCPACSCCSKASSSTWLLWAMPSSSLSLETRAPTTSSQTGRALFFLVYVLTEISYVQSARWISVATALYLHWPFILKDSWWMETNFAFCILVFSCYLSMFTCDYRTSVLGHGLGFNTSSLHSLNINVTSLGRTYGNSNYHMSLWWNSIFS